MHRCPQSVIGRTKAIAYGNVIVRNAVFSANRQFIFAGGDLRVCQYSLRCGRVGDAGRACCILRVADHAQHHQIVALGEIQHVINRLNVFKLVVSIG